MKKLNSNEFYSIKTSNYNKHDLNVNLWDLEGSNFFIDKNINENKPKRAHNIATINSKNKSISLKNINQEIKPMKAKNRSTNSSFIKYSNIIDKMNIKNEKDKKDLNLKKNKIKHNSFFNYKNENRSFDNNIKEEYKKRVKKRFNFSVDYSRNEMPNMALIFSNNNNDLFNKNHKLSGSLLIDTLNNKTDNISNKINSDISSLKNNKNIISIKYSNSNKQEKTKCNDNNINNNFNIRNINHNKYNNYMKKKMELKLNQDNLDKKQNRKKSEINKRTIENAEKYTNYLYKKKIFSHDYELQNKLKKEKEEKETEKELSQCTFKPKLYANKYNNRIQSQKKMNKTKSIYEKNSIWSNKLKEKNEKERKLKINKEKEGCTFTPQISRLPKYNNKKNSISSREIIGEENYYNKMKKARKIIEEKKKGNDLVEKYDERTKKKDILPRSIVTFGNFNLEKSEVLEETGNTNNVNIHNYNNININNLKIEKYSFKNNISELDNINNNTFNNDISESNFNNFNIINNFKYPKFISNKQISANDLDLSNKKINNNVNINTNKFINDRINLKKKSQSSKNKINPSIIYGIKNEINENKSNNNKINENIKNINLINKYQRENNYDFDNNFIDEKFLNKNKLNVINTISFLNPTIHYEEKEQEKENNNISTGTVTKANSIVSLQKKSTHSLPDRPDNMEHLLYFNLNDYKNEKNMDNNIINKNININNNLQDEDFIRQRKMLMNELHNFSNYDEDSNENY